MEQQADHAHLSVSVDEVDKGVKSKAEQLGISEHELWARAHAQGYTDQDYRDEVRRQLLEGKLLQLRLAGRVHITEADARATYERVVRQLGESGPVDLEVLSLRIAGPAAIEPREALAQQLVLRGRSGESWCDSRQAVLRRRGHERQLRLEGHGRGEQHRAAGRPQDARHDARGRDSRTPSASATKPSSRSSSRSGTRSRPTSRSASRCTIRRPKRRSSTSASSG